MTTKIFNSDYGISTACVYVLYNGKFLLVQIFTELLATAWINFRGFNFALSPRT